MELNPMPTADYHDTDRSLEVDLTDSRLAKITRLRLLSDPGCPFWDLSYCHGVLADGTPVRVALPQYQFDKRGLRIDILEMCREAGVYGKRLGIFDAISTLI